MLIFYKTEMQFGSSKSSLQREFQGDEVCMFNYRIEQQVTVQPFIVEQQATERQITALQPTAEQQATAQQPSSEQVVDAHLFPAKPKIAEDTTPSTPLQLKPVVVEETVHANSSISNSYNQLSSTPDGQPLCCLPRKINQGILKLTYEVDHKCKTKYSMSRPTHNSKVRYLLNNYVSTSHLFESNKSFVNQLSIVYIPNSVQEALVDPSWNDAINKKLRSLKKNATWQLSDYQ